MTKEYIQENHPEWFKKNGHNLQLTESVVEECISTTMKNPDTGMSYSPKRYENKTVLRLSRDYGKARQMRLQGERKQRQQEWRKISPEKRLNLLNANIPLGSKKEKLRLENLIKTKDKVNKGKK